MTVRHRHLDIAEGTPVDELPLDALDDLLDRGDLDDWSDLARAVRREPHGPLAERILALSRAHDMYGTSRLWPAFIERVRALERGQDLRVSTLRRYVRALGSELRLAAEFSDGDPTSVELESRPRRAAARR